MAADLHIHIITNKFTEEHFKAFESRTLGSKYYNEDYESRTKFEKKHGCDLYKLINTTPNVWVGEVSWLKAAISGDTETYIPPPVMEIFDIIGEDFPIIDDKLIEKIKKALSVDNGTGYKVASGDNVINFLIEHKGKRAFTISW